MPRKEKTPETELVNKIGSDANKKIEAKRHGKEIMYGMGVFGIVGFSIAVPTLLGVFLGLYLDGRIDSQVSFTITFLFGGLIIGCLNAWRWVKETSRGD